MILGLPELNSLPIKLSSSVQVNRVINLVDNVPSQLLDRTFFLAR